MKRIAWVAAALIGGASCSAGAASFNCARANSIPEYLICNTPELSQADDQLKGLFDAARAKAVDANAFKEYARTQWNSREKNCRDVSCLRQWFADQTAHYASALGIPTPAMPAQSGPPATSSQSHPQANYRAGPPLGATPKSAPPSAQASVASNFPQFSAEDLYKLYDENEVAADMQLKGRMITILGRVHSISVSFDGNPYVTLSVPGKFLSGVRLDFSKNKMPQLAQLQKGSTVRVHCMVQGMIVTTPVLQCPD